MCTSQLITFLFLLRGCWLLAKQPSDSAAIEELQCFAFNGTCVYSWPHACGDRLSCSPAHICIQVHSVSRWISTQIPHLPHRGYEKSYKIWYGKEITNEMKTAMGITPSTYTIYMVGTQSVLGCVCVRVYVHSTVLEILAGKMHHFFVCRSI